VTTSRHLPLDSGDTTQAPPDPAVQRWQSIWRQLTIIHMTDLHFGANHSFNPPDGGAAANRPKLADSILNDLQRGKFAVSSEFRYLFDSGPSDGKAPPLPRVIVAVTGDFNEKCLEPEFVQARAFLSSFENASVFNSKITSDDIFMVPGNHDLKYADDAIEDRWAKYSLFYQDHDRRRTHFTRPVSKAFFDPREPDKLSRVIDQSSRGLIVIEINSSAYVQKGTQDERRGQIDDVAIDRIEAELKKIPRVRRQSAIKIALVHHHPVVLPALAEAERGYDGILGSQLLLDLLKRYGFHVLLHGHKHNPHTFSYDAVCAWTKDEVQPLLIVAGGSAGSAGLPDAKSATNTYNLISIKWHPGISQARIHVETRGLVRENAKGQGLPGPQWHWATLRLDDRVLSASRKAPRRKSTDRSWDATDQKYADLRSEVLRDTRRNFPAIEIFPSLNPTQGYEARVWIEGQFDNEGQPHNEYQRPVKVEWSAAPRYFKKIYVCRGDSDPDFSARFSYYGPTLLQARMFWDDGHEAQAYIYARYPRGDRR
jgi:3',5'-cyclic AMP phosphodiesterase CpdA